MKKIIFNKELVNDIIQWDVNSWSKALYFWNEKLDFSNKNIGLELGAKNGGLSLYLALNGLNTICSDYIDCTLIAKPLHEKYNVTSLINYETIDALNIPYENYFDVIAFKSILGGIGRNNNYDNIIKTINQIYKALKPG
jgi:2-polyprenyl-3-methyl-5-hydroxy-6-metoxy-1,4-benzoquinol methylase